MLSPFDYKNMWNSFKKKRGRLFLNINGELTTGILKDVMNEFEKEYVKKNKNRLGYHDVEEFYKDNEKD